MTQYVQEKVERLEQPFTAWALLGVIACLVFAYACFVDLTISNIVATKTMQSQVVAVTSSVSDLESKYLAAKSTITMDDAVAQGFTQSAGDIVYLSRANAGSLSFNR